MKRVGIEGSPLTMEDLAQIEFNLMKLGPAKALIQLCRKCNMSVDGIAADIEQGEQFLTHVRDTFFPVVPIDQKGQFGD